MILGIDVGNYNTTSSEGVIFESKVSSINRELRANKIVLESEEYFVGQGSFDTQYRKVEKETYIKLLYAAMCKSTDEEHIELALGLPLSQYKTDKEALRKLIEENFYLRGTKEFYIENVEVYPEGLVCLDNDYEGILVDIGGRTTDVCFIENVGSKRKVINPSSLASGMINLENDFINLLNNKYGLDLAIKDFKRIIRSGLKIYGEQQDISFAINIFKEYLEQLLKDINLNYNFKLNNITFTGGGSLTLKNPILKRIPHAAILDDSLFGNANSFKRMLEEEYK